MSKRAISPLSGVAFILAASGSAFAADMAVKAPPPPPPPPAPVYSWTGWYVGGDVGYGWGDAHTDIAGSGTTTINIPGVLFITTPGGTFADSVTQQLQGVIGGGQFGYNYQISPRWVLGFETDIQASAERTSDTFSAPFSGTYCNHQTPPTTCSGTVPTSGVAATSLQSNIDWFGTARGRVGYLLNDGLLLYGTGGLAYGGVRVSGNANVSAANTVFPFTFGPTTSTFDQSKTNIGFAAGAGLEGRLAPWLSPNWTWKLEYLYVDLGSIDTSTSFTVTSTSATTTLPMTMTTQTHFTDNIARVGLNYQFH